MKNADQILTIAGLGGVALFAWWLLGESNSSAEVLEEEIEPEEVVYDPFAQTNPGIYDGSFPGFNSVINVDVDPSMFGSLSKQYIPLFGMIGVVPTGIAPPPPPPEPIAPRRNSGIIRMSSRNRRGPSTRRATIGNSGAAGGSRG
jgi:hypothetical protein